MQGGGSGRVWPVPPGGRSRAVDAAPRCRAGGVSSTAVDWPVAERSVPVPHGGGSALSGSGTAAWRAGAASRLRGLEGFTEPRGRQGRGGFQTRDFNRGAGRRGRGRRAGGRGGHPGRRQQSRRRGKTGRGWSSVSRTRGLEQARVAVWLVPAGGRSCVPASEPAAGCGLPRERAPEAPSAPRRCSGQGGGGGGSERPLACCSPGHCPSLAWGSEWPQKESKTATGPGLGAQTGDPGLHGGHCPHTPGRGHGLDSEVSFKK